MNLHRRAEQGEQILSPESIAVLAHLAKTGPITNAEACRHFSRSQAATSEIIGRLERRGLLSRIADERDKRRSLIWLTENGRTELKRSTEVLDQDRLSLACSKMTEKEREQVLDSLKLLLQHSETHDD
jgi:DNA-binding MarR family transcriptional regulator